MRTHNLKLKAGFWDAVMSGEKPFEVRLNDRGFQKGDRIIFGKVANEFGISYLNSPEFEITYVLNEFGLKDGFVCLGIKEVRDE